MNECNFCMSCPTSVQLVKSLQHHYFKPSSTNEPIRSCLNDIDSQLFRYFNDVQIQLVHVSKIEPFVLLYKHFNLSDRCHGPPFSSKPDLNDQHLTKLDNDPSFSSGVLEQRRSRNMPLTAGACFRR